MAHDAIHRSRERLIEKAGAADPLGCDRCGGNMVIRSTQVSEEPCRDDVRIKCMDCYWWTQHGLPIERDVYEMEMDKRDHRLVDAVGTDDGDREFEERLEALGYLDA